MKVLVVGGSGFIGRHVVAALRERGDEVVVSGRSEARLAKAFGDGVGRVVWDPTSGPLPPQHLAGVGAVVNLAGDNVAKGRWTKRKRRRIRESRVLGTRNLVAGLAAADPRPGTLVNASAVGYYGDRGHNLLHEHSEPGTDFLAQVCREWEAEAARAREHGVRTAIVRFGIVLARDGGAYPRMTFPFRLFLGGKIGLGRRWMSWVHIQDAVGIVLHCLDRDACTEVYNATAPNPVPNEEWTRVVARVLRRPALLPVPPFLLRLVLGGFGAVVLASQRVQPLRTLAAGYSFRWPELEPAVRHLEGR